MLNVLSMFFRDDMGIPNSKQLCEKQHGILVLNARMFMFSGHFPGGGSGGGYSLRTAVLEWHRSRVQGDLQGEGTWGGRAQDCTRYVQLCL